MRRAEVDGHYLSLETYTDADERRELADEWDEVSTVKTEVFWPPEATKPELTIAELARLREALIQADRRWTAGDKK